MRAFQAYGTGSVRVTMATAKEAAVAFFERNPGKRKCNVTEGETDGHFFTVTLGLAKNGQRRQSWTDVTKKTALTLPGPSLVSGEGEPLTAIACCEDAHEKC